MNLESRGHRAIPIEAFRRTAGAPGSDGHPPRARNVLADPDGDEFGVPGSRTWLGLIT